jgi:hypothetical protein
MYNTWKLHRKRIIDACRQQNFLLNHREKSAALTECPVKILSPLEGDNQSRRLRASARVKMKKREFILRYFSLFSLTFTYVMLNV